MRDKDPDIYILGAGVRTPDHLTLETIGALRRVNVVFTIYPLSETDCHQLSISADVKCLWPLYESSVVRKDTYQVVADTVLNSARSQRPVAYLSPGNPIVSDSVAQLLLSQGSSRGLIVRLLPAVSCLDTVMADLGSDVSPGLQIYDSSYFVASNIVPCVAVDCLLLQVTTFGTWFSTIGKGLRPGALSQLRDYLVRFYPPEHQVIFVQSATRFSSATTWGLAIAALDEVQGVIPGTLFIPRLSDPKPNSDFTQKMTDRRSFELSYRRITGDSDA